MAHLIEKSERNIVRFGQYDVAKSPYLLDALELARKHPERVFRTFAAYHMIIRDLFTLTPEDVRLIHRVNQTLGKTHGADEFIAHMGRYQNEILTFVRRAGDTTGKFNRRGVKELAQMMHSAEQLKQAEPDWKPKDGDTRADNVIWGFVNGATDPQVNIDFVIGHGIERIVTQHFRSTRHLEYTKKKDWLLSAITDVVALRGLQGHYPESTFLRRWSQKRPEGLGWISQQRLDAYNAFAKIQ